ncbi:hypothetical protein [Desmospora profundinema]|uniref:Uncharacterized protein n=1 Tax=Desmospora profundinema TaxID=1571184 RepID=A0ABU1IQW9_9BACL|nr:hypothetical protein [Desmospora profundinema]MDR6226334.1 hypothetical protein [Desmospora profundinema]
MNRQQLMLAALFTGSGAALLVYILSGISLLATFFVTVLGAVLIGSLIWRKATDHKRKSLKALVKVGLLSGVLATLAYDLSRYLLVTLTPMTVWPFEAFMVFGQAFVGEEVRGPGIFMLGTVYHVINGLTFAIAYAIAFARKGIWAGLTWALLLEALMLTVYPGWLRIDQIGQFVGMSIFGHVFYGLVLGVAAQRLIIRYEGGKYGGKTGIQA